jgi:hypothetical protein
LIEFIAASGHRGGGFVFRWVRFPVSAALKRGQMAVRFSAPVEKDVENRG